MTKLRTYKKNTAAYNCYAQMHKNQTLQFANDKRRHYSKLIQPKMSIKQALAHMDDFIDPSDPDLDLPNSIHAYQTAERIRKNQHIIQGIKSDRFSWLNFERGLP